MAVDFKLSEILKATGWQALAAAAAAGGVLLLIKLGWLAPLDSPWPQALAFVAILGLVLAAGNMARAASSALNAPLQRYLAKHAQRRRLREYIPFMTPEERAIIGYLLARNQKSFTCAVDGGRAATLISRGIVVRALRAGQVFDHEEMPVAIHDHLWDLLTKGTDEFPDTFRQGDPHPWREHWMVR